MSPRRITAVLLIIAATYLHLQVSLGAPQEREAGPTATLGSLTADQCEPECRPFQHFYCNTFNYYYAQFPNPRQGKESELPDGRTYEQDAFIEFNHFLPALDTECSDKLGTFLCFFYFPFCIPHPDIKVSITPCRSLCEEVISNCADQLKAFNITLEDLQHFNCSHYEYNGCNGPKGGKVYIEEEHLCANDTQTLWPPIFPMVPDAPTKEATESPPTTESAKEATCSSCTAESFDDKCPQQLVQCKIRKNLNSQLFVRNEEYNYAFRATLEQFVTLDCRHALNFTVHEQYPVKSSEDCSEAPEVPAGSTIIALGSGSECENCFLDPELKLKVGTEYALAGVFHRTDGDCVFWELGSSHALIVPYAKKFGKIVKKGNDSRHTRCQE